MELGGVNDIMPRSVGWGFWDLEKSVSWVPASEQESRDSELGKARRICALRASHVGWLESWRCKSSQHRKIVSLSLSPHVKKPLNSKRWIKVSYLNQFCVFRFLNMFMNNYERFSTLWTLYMLHFHHGGVYCGVWDFRGSATLIDPLEPWHYTHLYGAMVLPVNISQWAQTLAVRNNFFS